MRLSVLSALSVFKLKPRIFKPKTTIFRCLQTPVFGDLSEFLQPPSLCCVRFLGLLPVRNFSPAPLPCHRAWPRPISPDVVKLRGSFRRTPPMNLAPLARGVVRLVRGVHHDPTAARTPIGHVREHLSVIFRGFVSDHKSRWPGRYWGKTETETSIFGSRSLIWNTESKN